MQVTNGEQHRQIVLAEYAKMEEAGLHLPHMFTVVGKSTWHEDELLAVTERIVPVSLDAMPPETVRRQSYELLEALMRYRETACTEGRPYNNDVFDPSQFVYGTSVRYPEPTFHMVDLDCYLDDPNQDWTGHLFEEGVTSLASELALRTGEPNLTAFVQERLESMSLGDRVVSPNLN